MTVMCLSHTAVIAQVYPNTPVTVSQDRTVSGGKKYYVHPVLDHQTLYSISKAYSVSLDEIVEANPDLNLRENGLKTGQVLLIPDNGQIEAARQAETSLKEAERQSTASAKEAEVEGRDYIVYVVKWYDDLGTIAARYNVSKEVLMAYNGLESQKLTKKQKLRIPLDPSRVGGAAVNVDAQGSGDSPVADAQTAEDSGAAEETLAEEAADAIRRLFHRKDGDIEVAVVLPFNAKSKVNDSAFDLYSGMLLAARDLASSGVKLSIKALDSKASQVSAEMLEGADMVLGPIAPDDLKAVLAVCPEGTAVISPLDPGAVSLASGHSNFIQAPSSADAQYAEIVKWIGEDMEHGDRILLVTEKGATATAVSKYLSESGLTYATCSYSITEGRTISLDRYMSEYSTTRVVIASDKEAFVNDVVRNLNLMSHRKFDVVLYAPSRIRNYETIDIESLHGISAHIASSYLIDYDSSREKSFLMSYRALFGAEPTPFAYQGYDTMRAFVSCYDKYGKHWIEKMCSDEQRGLQSNFRLRRAGEEGEDGYLNQAVRRAVYETDYTIRILR